MAGNKKHTKLHVVKKHSYVSADYPDRLLLQSTSTLIYLLPLSFDKTDRQTHTTTVCPWCMCTL